MNKTDVDLIDYGEFKILHIKTNPQRLEAKVIFDRDHISQKLIFTIMEIAHDHGFGCSPPNFNGPDDPSMVFFIGTILPTKRSLDKYLKKLGECLLEIKEFAFEFSEQLDFSMVDISMFGKIEVEDFYPEHLAALRDQHYDGSWEEFHEAMVKEKRNDEAELIQCCIEFEETNCKDIGLIGHKLSYMLYMLENLNFDNAN